MFSKLTLILACCLYLLSCSSNEQDSMQIDFSKDSTAIIFSGLDEVSAFRAKEQADSIVKELISITEISKAEEGLEKLVGGSINVKGNEITFIPDTPFVKGRSYLVQTLLNSSFGKTTDILKSDMGKTIKRQEKILER